jgi:hypothetical protein
VANGKAAGPFPGTFTEQGVIIATASEVSILRSTFTIFSPSGTVTGTIGPQSAGQVDCSGLFEANLTTVYTVQINGVSGSGPTTVSIKGSPIEPQVPTTFIEAFGSTGVGVEQNQCKHGAWKSFGTMFKNQGDCVSFFATHGKNPPGGS